MSTKLELFISDIIVRSYSKCSNCCPWPSGRARGWARTKMVGPRPYLVYCYSAATGLVVTVTSQTSGFPHYYYYY